MSEQEHWLKSFLEEFKSEDTTNQNSTLESNSFNNDSLVMNDGKILDLNFLQSSNNPTQDTLPKPEEPVHLWELFNSVDDYMNSPKYPIICKIHKPEFVFYNWETARGAIRPSPKTKGYHYGIGSYIECEKSKEEPNVWILRLKKENITWLNTRKALMGIQTFANMIELQENWIRTAEFYKVTSLGKRRIEETLCSPAPKKHNCSQIDAPIIINSYVGDVTNRQPAKVEDNSWGITSVPRREGRVIELFAKNGVQLVVLTKQQNYPFETLLTTPLFESEELAREIITIAKRIRYLTTNKALYRVSGSLDPNNPPTYAKISSQFGKFHGLACGDSFLLYCYDREIIMLSYIDDKQTRIFKGDCMLVDLAFHIFKKTEIIIFVLDELGGIHTLILPYHCHNFTVSAHFILEAKNNNEQLDLQGALCITAQLLTNNFLQLFISNTKRNQIVKIFGLDSKNLCKHRRQRFACRFEVVSECGKYSPVSHASNDREGKPTFYSAFENPDALSNQEPLRTSVPVSDAPAFDLVINQAPSLAHGPNNTTNTTGNKGAPTSNDKSSSSQVNQQTVTNKDDCSPEYNSDDGSDSEDQNEANVDNLSETTDRNLYEEIVSLISQILNISKCGEAQRHLVDKLFASFDKVTKHQQQLSHWKVLTALWKQIFDDEAHCLKKNIQIALAGNVDWPKNKQCGSTAITSAQTEEHVGRVVKINSKSGAISFSLSEISSNDIIRPISDKHAPSVIYGPKDCKNSKSQSSSSAPVGSSGEIQVTVWGDALVKADNTKLKEGVHYYAVADPTSHTGICKIIPKNECLFTADPRFVVGALLPSEQAIALTNGDTMIVRVTLPFLPGEQINSFLSDLRNEALRFHGHEKSEIQQIQKEHPSTLLSQQTKALPIIPSQLSHKRSNYSPSLTPLLVAGGLPLNLSIKSPQPISQLHQSPYLSQEEIPSICLYPISIIDLQAIPVTGENEVISSTYFERILSS